MPSTPEGEMPPLPLPYFTVLEGFTAEQMYAYLRDNASKYAATSAAQAAGGGAAYTVQSVYVSPPGLWLACGFDVVQQFKHGDAVHVVPAAPDHPSPSREGPSDAEMLQAIANKIAAAIPVGFEIQLCLEREAGWVTLRNEEGDCIPLPDAADKSLHEQINDAVAAAKEHQP